MDDAEYMFRRDTQEKKNIAHSAAHRKGGSRSKRCTLPSDSLTKTQMEKKNGDVKTVRMNEFLTFERFKQLPPELMVEYINGLCEKYKVGLHCIERYVFEIGENTLRYYLDKYGVLSKIKQHGVRGTGGRENKNRLLEDVRRQRGEPDKAEHIESGNLDRLQSITVSTDGLDGETFGYLCWMFGDRAKKVTISIELGGET